MSDDDLQLDDAEARVDGILRSMTADDLDLQTPPDSVWAGIEAQFAAAAHDAAAPATGGAADTAEPADEIAPVISLASRRRPALLAAAVAAALVLVAGIAVVFTDDDNGPVELASAELVYLDGDPGFVEQGIGRSVDVTLVADDDQELVRVDAADLPPAGADSDLEIWLIGVAEGEIQIVQTLGLVEDPADPGTFAVPTDFDRDAYDAVAVDISIEPHDGDEAHSGMSLVRGNLAEA